MVTGSEDRVQREEDRLVRAGEGDNLVRRDAAVHARDLGPQRRHPAGLGVAELEAVPQLSSLLVGEREQVEQAEGLDVGGAEQVLGPRSERGEEALELEPLNAAQGGGRHVTGACRLPTARGLSFSDIPAAVAGSGPPPAPGECS